MRGHARIDRQMLAERTRQNFDAVAVLEPTLGKLDGPIALAATDFLDYGTGHLCRLQPVHHEADDAGAPAGGVPLELDLDKRIGGEQGYLALHAPPANDSPLTQPRGIGRKLPLAEQMQCQRLALWLQLSDRPVGHGRPLPMTAAVVFGYAKPSIERRRHEERPLCQRDRAVHVAVADNGARVTARRPARGIPRRLAAAAARLPPSRQR